MRVSSGIVGRELWWLRGRRGIRLLSGVGGSKVGFLGFRGRGYILKWGCIYRWVSF